MFAQGNYLGTLQSAAMDTLNNEKRTPFMRLTFDITHEPGDGEWVPVQQPAQRDVRLFTSEKAWQYTQKKLEALQFNGDFGKPSFGAPTNVELICKHEPYQNDSSKFSEGWDLASWGTKEVAPPSNDIIRQLNARYKTAVGAAAKPAGKPAAPAPKAAPAKPAAPAADGCTLEEAWAVFAEANAKLTKPYTDEELAKQWFATIEQIIPGKIVEQFTPQDWAKIRDEAVLLPF